MASVNSINISKGSTGTSYANRNASPLNQHLQQASIAETQTSQQLANISQNAAQKQSQSMQTSKERTVQLERRSEGAFNRDNKEDDAKEGVEHHEKEEKKELRVKV